MTNIDHIINDITEKESSRRARWIDIQLMKLLSPFYQELIKSSLTPDLIKRVIMRISGIVIEVRYHVGKFGHTVTIKQHGEVKASRIYT